MKHPEALLLPVMMFADYFLTVLGAIWSEKGYSKHFKIQHYELNPIWQKQIEEKKWFNPRHIVLTLLLSALLIFLLERGDLPANFAGAVLGCVLVLYGMVLGRHFSNVLLFSHLIRRPDEISGQVALSHELVLSLSLYQMSIVVIPIALIVVFAPSAFASGGVAGVLLFLAINLGWLRKAQGGQRASPWTGRIISHLASVGVAGDNRKSYS